MADAAAMGFELPDGQGYIKDGDDAIRINAQVAADQIEKTAYRRKNIAAGSNLDTYKGAGMDGAWSCLLASTCETLTGLPQQLIDNPRPFTLKVTTLTNTVEQLITTISVYGTDMLVRNSSPSNGTEWTAWERLLTEGDIPEQEPQERGYKTVPLALTVPASASNTESVAAACLRFPILYAVPIQRWRLHVQNINDRSGTTYPGSVSFTGAWFGKGSHDTGSASPALQQVMEPFTTPADGSEYIGPWISGAPIEAKATHLLSLGYTMSASTAAVSTAAAVWRFDGSSAYAHYSGISWPLSDRSPFSIWVEAEVSADTPVVATVASSSGAGVGSTLPVLESPVSLLCRRLGALPMHYAHPGSTLSIWNDESQHKWHKWAGYARPSAVLFSLGSNDLYGGRTLDEIKADAALVLDITARLASRNIYATTIPPRTTGDETKRRQYNTWLRTLPLGIRDLFDWSAAVSNDDETVLPAYDADGVHVTTAGAQAKADATTRPIVSPPHYTIDQSAGRTVKAWDYLNNREQLIYGDTGRRSVTPAIGTGTIHIRRVGNLVDVFIYNLSIPAGAATNDICPVPAGFRSPYAFGPYERGLVFTSPANGEPVTRRVGFFGNTLRLYGDPPADSLSGHLAYMTDDPWPTSLPGVAA